MDVINPATEEVVAHVEPTAPAEVDRLIDRAATAFPAWRAVAPGDRGRLLRRFASIVDSHVEELASLEVRNSGHTIANARWRWMSTTSLSGQTIRSASIRPARPSAR